MRGGTRRVQHDSHARLLTGNLKKVVVPVDTLTIHRQSVRVREGRHPTGKVVVDRRHHQVYLQKTSPTQNVVEGRPRKGPLRIECFLATECVGHHIQGWGDPQHLEPEVPGDHLWQEGQQLLAETQGAGTAWSQGVMNRLVVREDTEREVAEVEKQNCQSTALSSSKLTWSWASWDDHIPEATRAETPSPKETHPSTERVQEERHGRGERVSKERETPRTSMRPACTKGEGWVCPALPPEPECCCSWSKVGRRDWGTGAPGTQNWGGPPSAPVGSEWLWELQASPGPFDKCGTAPMTRLGQPLVTQSNCCRGWLRVRLG